VVNLKFITFLGSRVPVHEAHEKPAPFDYAQGRLSVPLKYASLRMTGVFLI
jgi:hypothetical protein